MKAVADAGAATEAAWNEVVSLCQARGKLAKIEWQRMLAARMMISPEVDRVFKECLIQSIRRQVKDPAILQALARDLSTLLFDNE